MQRSRTILVVGAGIGGLCAALCLARQGYRIALFEQNRQATEVGAGLQLSPNATRSLGRLGVLDSLRALAFQPPSIRLHAASGLNRLAELPLGEMAERRWGAPYLVMHRADLVSTLWDAVAAEPEVEIVSGARIDAIETGETGALLSLPDRSDVTHHGLFVIGADGVRSTVRRHLPGSREPQFTGKVAWRSLVEAKDVPPQIAELVGGSVTAILHPGFHLVIYPLGEGRGVNLVAVTEGADLGGSWDNPGDASVIRRRLARADRHLGALGKAANWTNWSLYSGSPRGRWSDGNAILLLGDSAHAMTPFAAQGAAMAVEDGAVLARLLQSFGGDNRRALRQFEAERRPRIARVRRRASFNHFAWHARFPVSTMRNLVLARRSGADLMADFDWLYGFDADA